MARGPSTFLIRTCSSKNTISRIRGFIFNWHFHSHGKWELCGLQNHPISAFPDMRTRPFSTDFDNVIRVVSNVTKTMGLGRTINPKLNNASFENEDDDDLSEFDDFMAQENSHSINIDKIHAEFKAIASLDPAEFYRLLCANQNKIELSKSDLGALEEIFDGFSSSGWATNQSLGIYISASFFPSAVIKFRDFFIKRASSDVVQCVVSLSADFNTASRFIFPIFAEFCLDHFKDEISKFKSMIKSADLTKPHTWFPFARAMKRKIIYHCGPTNSGKTFNALQCFMEAKTAVYCSPLRLLAMEVFDKVNGLGVYCSLYTGQEKQYVPFSNHVSCTVEMVSCDDLYDVAVIDEIQMMADPCRGYAWTKALLGLKADEIHLCGDPSVLQIIRKICSDTGDELVESHYQRFKPLVVEAKTLLDDIQNIRSGDCLVAFSRHDIFKVKLLIESSTSHRCCVIYGALPPEIRRQQATLFNDQHNEFDVLVASDAVGMGLNLNIRRVVFCGLAKFNGDKHVPVDATQVKQIAGRAGRRGCLYPDGLTTTFKFDDLDYLIDCMKKPFNVVTKVGLFPCFEQVELFAGQFGGITFSELLQKFTENCTLDGSYFLCHTKQIMKIANMLERIPGLSLEDRFNFCFAPVNTRDPKAMYYLMKCASSYSQRQPVGVLIGMPKASANNDSELLDLESKHHVCSMYVWLSYHFQKEHFIHVKKAETMAMGIAGLLAESLLKANWKPEVRKAKPAAGNKIVKFEKQKTMIKHVNSKKISGQDSQKRFPHPGVKV